MRLALGNYGILSETNFDLSESVPPWWYDYISEFDEPTEIRLRVSCEGMPSCEIKRNHWKADCADGITHACYYDSGKMLFSLKYGADVEAELKVGPDIGRTLPMGLHYAAMCLLAKQCVGLHGVTVICRDQAIILSAPSGTGKSTLAGLLRRYGDAAIVNGDFAFLSRDEDGKVWFEPTPFCGTSKTCVNARFPISRIVFLAQSPVNEFCTPDARKALRLFCSNAFMAEWDPPLNESIMRNVLSIAEMIPMEYFAFAPDSNAVEVFYRNTVYK